MATINFYEDLFNKPNEVKRIKKSVVLKDIVEAYIQSKDDVPEFYETYNVKTGKTVFKPVTINGYKIIVIVNGEEKDLSYKTKFNDVVSIFYIPQGGIDAGDTVGSINVISGIMFMLAGAVLGFATMGVGGWAALGAAGLVSLGAAEMSWGTAQLNYNPQNKNVSEKESQALLSVKGGSNQIIINQRYPIILGKHLINPYVVGSPWHETVTKSITDGKDLGQWFHILYCIGYGPLKLTDFKLGDNILCYNKFHKGYNHNTVIHGQLNSNPYELAVPHPSVSQVASGGYYQKKVSKSGTVYEEAHSSDWSLTVDYYKKVKGFENEIESKFLKNDVKLEILQAGTTFAGSDTRNKFGTVYNQVVDEQQVNAGLLYVTDEALSENDNIRTVYNTGVELGFRSNTVHFSKGCPLKLEVEIELPNGLYGARQYRSADGNSSETRYYTIPIDIAVQWRFSRNNELPSNVESGDGWNTFDYMVTNDNPEITPLIYDQDMIDQAIELNKGIKLNNNNINSDWKGKYIFRLNTAKDVNGNPLYWKEMTANEISVAENQGIITHSASQDFDYYTYRREPIETSPYFEEVADVNEGHHYIVTSGHSKDAKVVYETRTDAAGKEYSLYVCYKPSFSDWEVDESGNFEPTGRTKEDVLDDNGNVIQEGFNVNGRRYVFSKTFSETECRQMINKVLSDTPEEYKSKALDSIEVRVVRLSPCYINQPADDVSGESSYGEMSYQDLVKWTYLRTYTFDKKKYEKAFTDIEDTLPSQSKGIASYYSQVFAKNFIERPISDDDLNKFCYVALSMKEDVLGTVSKYFSDFNCIAEAFTPKYDTVNQNWYPLSITEEYAYYHKRKNSYDKWVIDSISKSEYDQYILTDPDNTYKSRKGTNFVNEIRKLIFQGNTIPVDENGNKIVSPMTRYCLSNEMERLYISNNTASVFMYSMLGAHLGEYQKSFSDIDINMTEEAFKFYEDVTDGTTENYYNYVNTTDEDYLTALAKVREITGGAASTAKEILKELYGTPINALRAGIKTDVLGRFCELVNLDYYYKEKVIDAIETYSTSGFSHTVSDGKRHFKFTCNGIVTNEVKMENLSKSILLTGRSYLTRTDGNKYAPLIGRPNPYPINVLNQRNCISKSNTRNFNETPSGFQINFIDETDNFRNNDIYVMADGEDPKSPTKEIESMSFQFVTNRWQLYSLARFNLACRIYQRESYQRTIGVLGYTISIGDTILIQDDSLLIGTDNGARITELLEDENYIYGLITDDGFQYNGNVDEVTGLCEQGITIIQPKQFGSSRCVTLRMAKETGIRIPKSTMTSELARQITNINNKTQDDDYFYIIPTKGITNIILFDHAIDKSRNGNEESVVDGEFCVLKPNIGDLIAFGKVGSITSKAVVMAISPRENEQFELSLVPYDEDLYNAGDELPVFNANITIPNRTPNILYDTRVTTSELLEHIRNNQAWMTTRPEVVTTPPDRPIAIHATATKDGITLQCDYDSSKWQNTLGAILWRITRADGSVIGNETVEDPDGVLQTITARTVFETSEYTFNRETDGYPETHVNLINYNERMDDEYGEIASVSFKIPEKCDISNWKIECCLQNAWGLTGYFWRQQIPGGFQTYINPSTERYGTWIPPVIESQYLDPVVQEKGIIVNNYSQPLDSNYFYGYPYQIIYEYSRAGDINAKNTFSRSGSTIENMWKFIRTPEEDPQHQDYYDGYPEKPNTDYAITDITDPLYIGNAKIWARFKSSLLYNNTREGERSTAKSLNWDTYLTWFPEVDTENCRVGVNKRYVTFTGEQNPNRGVYGNTKYAISVSRARQEYVDGKPDNGDWTGVSPYSNPEKYRFYNLDTSMTDVYLNENSYKIEDEEIIEKDDVSLRVNRTHLQEFPLLGQNLSMYHLYQYRYKKFNETLMYLDVLNYFDKNNNQITRKEYLEMLAEDPDCGVYETRKYGKYTEAEGAQWMRDPLNGGQDSPFVFYDGFYSTSELDDKLEENPQFNFDDSDSKDRYDWKIGPTLIQGVYVYRNYHLKKYSDTENLIYIKAPSSYNSSIQKYYIKLSPFMICDDDGNVLDLSPVVYNNKGYLCISVTDAIDMFLIEGRMYNYNGMYKLVRENPSTPGILELYDVTNEVTVDRVVAGVLFEREV